MCRLHILAQFYLNYIEVICYSITYFVLLDMFIHKVSVQLRKHSFLYNKLNYVL